MPRWDIHIACGISVSFLYLVSASLPLIGNGDAILSATRSLALPLLIGTMALLLGSILPDIDGRGRVRWIIGPIIGAFVLALTTIRAFLMDGMGGAISYLIDDGALLFLIATAAGYASLLVPLSHRGVMHKAPAALSFALAVAISFMMAIESDLQSVALVGSMAFSGYGWHLAMDGSA